jgi:hypothetical protein
MTDFPVNTYTPSFQSRPAVAMDGTGNFVVTWQSYGQDGSGYGIYAQRYTAAGVAIGSEFRVNSFTPYSQRDPAVAMDAAGNFVVTWEFYQFPDIYTRPYNAAGEAVGNEFRVNSFTPNRQADPAVAMDAAGNFVVTWTSGGQDGAGYGIYAQRYNAAGEAVGSEFRVNSYTTDYQVSPAVAMNAAGNFVVTWMSNVQDGSGWGIYAQRYNAAGVAIGSEFRVNSYTTSDQSYPAVAMDAAGNFVVTWMSLGQDGSGYGIYAQRYNAAGVAIGSEFRVNSYTPYSQRDPAVAMDAAGNFVVTWMSGNQDGYGYGIYAQRYNAAGEAVGSEFRVNSYTTSDQRYPAVAMDGAGNFVVTWTSYGQDGSGSGIFLQKFTPDLTPLPQLDLDASGAGTGFAVTVARDAPSAAIADTDAVILGAATHKLAGLTATLGTRPDGASESLGLTAAASSLAASSGVSVSWNAGTGVLLLSGTATRGVYGKRRFRTLPAAA